MQLILHQYAKYKSNKRYNRKDDITYEMVEKFLEKNVEMHEHYMNVAVNFPEFLKCILKKNDTYYDELPKKVKKYFDMNFTNMDFVELILTTGDEVITEMMERWRCLECLKTLENKYKRTPLHIAAKLFKPSIVKIMMRPKL